MAEIICPMCSKPNPAERDVCQYCEARLKPLTDELSRSQPPIRPGEEPTEMDTGQLEPILPKWLRDIRQQSRESSEEEAEQPAEKSEADQQEAETDLLAGFRSQSEGDEEIPSWLAGLRSEGGNIAFEESSNEDDDMAALRSMLGDDAPVPAESEASPFPGWDSGQEAGETEQKDTDDLSAFLEKDTKDEPAQTGLYPSESSSDFRWDADFETNSIPQADSAESEKTFDTELPAWLRDTSDTQGEETDTGLPDWLSGEEPSAREDDSTPLDVEGELPAWLQDTDKSLSDETGDTGLPAWMNSETPATPAQGEGTIPPTEGDLPDWLASLGEEETGEAVPPQGPRAPDAKSTTDWLASLDEENSEDSPPQTTDSAIKSTTDWLASLDEETAETAAQQQPSQPADEGGMPDWLSSLGEESAERIPPQELEQPAASGDLPDWLAALGEESDQALPMEEPQSSGESEKPDWLASLGAESTATEDEVFSPGDEFVEPAQAATEAEIPDWLAAMGDETDESEYPADGLETTAVESDQQASEADVPPTFVDDEGQPISTEDVEAIFSMGMPDWLSDARIDPEESAAPASEDAQEDELRPAELPGWVQAMRPVESVISETEGVQLEDQPIEERGPLAGLRGVLPAVPGIGPSSKPKAYSIKLQASEDQLASATLLEKMLAEEVNPKPVATQKGVHTQRILRWIIAALLLLIVGGVVYYSPEVNPVPTGVPPEASAAVDYIKGILPENAPVLVVFDYEAARAGEMEAAAAPLIDQMLTLKAPRLSLVSSTPTGSGLAERFMTILYTDPESARNQNFINLGYLPGGAAGVQAFAGAPVTVKPLSTTGESAWSTPVLQDVSGLSGFAAIILLTDDIETARIWIEQTEGVRGEARLLVVSSAQSGPMIRPYLRSGQVDGMISGLDSSAPIEQANSGRPGMGRRYWDAYGFGLLAAVTMIVIGSIWSLVSGLQASRKEQGKG